MYIGRGGKRKGAGRKSPWKHPKTRLIRVPEIFADRLLEIAQKLDRNEVLDFGIEIKSKEAEAPPIAPEHQIPAGQLSLLGASATVCPRCGSSKIKKNGTEASRQRYVCKVCKKYFTQK